MFQRSLRRYATLPALTYQISPDVWASYTYQEYYDMCCQFGRACLSLGLRNYSPVMIIGFNAPEWIMAFYGAIFGRFLPIGMYTTYSPKTCQYVANHCRGEMVVVEN